MSKLLLQSTAVSFLALLTANGALAFSTFMFPSGPVHQEITTAALVNDPLIKVSKKSLKVIDDACTSQDAVSSPGFTDPSHHFCNCKITQGQNYIESCYREIDKHLGGVDKSESEWKSVLEQFGLMLHAAQDFYAHSNYIELKLAANESLLPSSIPLVDWQNISNKIRTGYFFYRSSYENESAVTSELGATPNHDTITSRLVEDKDIFPGTTYLKRVDYDKITTFKDRLAYANNPKLSVMHRDTNKDGPREEQGRVINPKTNITLYAYAKALATRETKRQWQRLEAMAREKYPERADTIIKILKNGFPEQQVVAFQRPKFGKLISIPLAIRNDSGGEIKVWTLGTDQSKEACTLSAGGVTDKSDFPAWLQINDKVTFQLSVPPNRFGVKQHICSWDYKPGCKPYLLYDGSGNRVDVRTVETNLDPAKMEPWLKD